MKTVILNGRLGKLFGRRHRLDVSTAAEAVRALSANHPGFERHLLTTEGVGYRIRLHDEALHDIKQMHHPVGPTITITPVIAGAKSGIGQILLGAAIIVGAAILAPVTAGGSIAWGSTAFTAAFGATITYGNIAMVGLSLALGGVAQMLAPTPPSSGASEAADNQPSYVFNGAVNTVAQGHPVPVGYGRMIVGGAVVSAGITTEEIAIA